jgi:hypothetical protein
MTTDDVLGLPPAAKAAKRATYKDPPHDPKYLPAIVQAWAEVVLPPQRNREMAVPGTRVRASQLGIPCDLALRYAIEGEPETEPPSLADEYRMMIGTMVHDAIESQIHRAFPDVNCEVKVDLRPDVNGSATVDIILTEMHHGPPLPDDPAGEDIVTTTLIELKTIGGYQFKIIAAPFRNGPTGPRLGALHQAAIAAKAIDADEMVLGYLSLELISKDLAKKMGIDDIGRFTAEWRYDRIEIAALAKEATSRFERVLTEIDMNVSTEARVADLDIAAGGVVTPPGSGRVVVAGKTVQQNWWGCDYCRHLTHCQGEHP